jgi:hypothetical protein
MYVLYISRYPVASKPEIYSSNVKLTLLCDTLEIYEIVTKSSAEAEFMGDPLERLDTDSYLCPLSRAGWLPSLWYYFVGFRNR